MVSPARRPKPRPFFAFGNAVDATIAIGNVAHGTLAIGLSLSVGVVSIGINAVGSFAAFGVNAAAPIAVAAVNAVGVFAIAGVNGFGSIGFAGVNNATHPLVGLVVSGVLFAVAFVHSRGNSGEIEDEERKPAIPDTAPFADARENGGWVRADRVDARGDRAAIFGRGGPPIEAQIAPGLEASVRALERDAAFVRLRVDTQPVADEGGYREASFERVAVVVDAFAVPRGTPPLRALGRWLARSKRVHVVFAGAGLAAAIAATIAASI